MCFCFFSSEMVDYCLISIWQFGVIRGAVFWCGLALARGGRAGRHLMLMRPSAGCGACAEWVRSVEWLGWVDCVIRLSG
jgi:hypothetical protein